MEDANFYQHPGVDPVAILRSFWYAIQEDRFVSGGSTITQQLARQLLLSQEEREGYMKALGASALPLKRVAFQDLKRLAVWTRANRVTRLKLSYFGSADPAYYGLDAEMLPGYTAPHAPRVTREIAPGDVVAVSATNLQGVYLEPEDRPLMERLRALQPIGRAGWSIRIYRADFSWPPALPARQSPVTAPGTAAP